MKKLTDYFYGFHNFLGLKSDDMATADLDKIDGAILVRKRMYFLKPRKKFKIKPIVKNGRIKNIEITAPYWFIVQLFKMLNYKPLIDEEEFLENRFGQEVIYVHREEWENSRFSDMYTNNLGGEKHEAP